MDAIHLETTSNDAAGAAGDGAVEFEEFSRAMQRLKLDVEVRCLPNAANGWHGIDAAALCLDFRYQVRDDATRNRKDLNFVFFLQKEKCSWNLWSFIYSHSLQSQT